MKEVFPGVFRHGSGFFTKNLTPGKKYYGERLVSSDGIEYREWDVHTSKLAAGLAKGLETFPIINGSKILYLGVAQGKTCSYISDIVGPNGIIYAVEISERAIRELIPLAEARKNIVPIAADARLPDKYSWIEKVDVIYEDVADAEQSEILILNAEKFLKKNGFGIISIKARSIDVTKDPKQIFKKEEEKLKKKFKIIQKIILEPFEEDHCMFVVQL